MPHQVHKTTHQVTNGALNVQQFAAHLRQARLKRNLTQVELAELAGISRRRLIKFETQQAIPDLDEALKIAGVLETSLQFLLTGNAFPPSSLAGIATELVQLGIRDLRISGALPATAFRPPEQVLVYAIMGNSPEPRILEAIPLVLLRSSFHAVLLQAFAHVHDARVLNRLAWLADIAKILFLNKTTFPQRMRLEQISEIGGEATSEDDLGRPATGKKLHPVWNRHKIAYGGTLLDFEKRAEEILSYGSQGTGSTFLDEDR